MGLSCIVHSNQPTICCMLHITRRSQFWICNCKKSGYCANSNSCSWPSVTKACMYYYYEPQHKGFRLKLLFLNSLRFIYELWLNFPVLFLCITQTVPIVYRHQLGICIFWCVILHHRACIYCNLLTTWTQIQNSSLNLIHTISISAL